MVKSNKGVYIFEINSKREKVWKALTDPKIVKQYFYGTDLETTWKVGSPIYFKGQWEGKSYLDKGFVQLYDINKALAYSYLSSLSGKEDKPENYLDISYELVDLADNRTRLTISQTNYSPEQAEHSKESWKSVIDALKKIVE